MRSNADVVYRDFDSSPALTDIIHKKLEKLNRFSDSIIHSRVVIDSPNKNKRPTSKAKIFRASIELDVKGSPMTVSHDDTSIHIAIRDAFNAAERKVKETRNKQRLKH